MTVISAMIHQRGTIVASDSLLTTYENGKQVSLEWEKSKIIRLPKFRGSITYWGFAGTYKTVDKTWNWNTYDWLSEECKNPKDEKVEDFVKSLTFKLEKKLSTFKIKVGIGLHITTYEYVQDYWIPELFLISNYANTDYNELGNLNYCRNTYHTLFKVPPNENHALTEYRVKVKRMLDDGHSITYNNGDPIMYNQVARTVNSGIQTAKDRKLLKDISNIAVLTPVVTKPIELIRDIQRDFYKPDMRIVGGRVHDLTITPNGEYSSTSGD